MGPLFMIQFIDGAVFRCPHCKEIFALVDRGTQWKGANFAEFELMGAMHRVDCLMTVTMLDLKKALYG